MRSFPFASIIKNLSYTSQMERFPIQQNPGEFFSLFYYASSLADFTSSRDQVVQDAISEIHHNGAKTHPSLARIKANGDGTFQYDIKSAYVTIPLIRHHPDRDTIGHPQSQIVIFDPTEEMVVNIAQSPQLPGWNYDPEIIRKQSWCSDVFLSLRLRNDNKDTVGLIGVKQQLLRQPESARAPFLGWTRARQLFGI